MTKGQRVIVRAFSNKVLNRVVWEEAQTYVVVCRPEVYEEAVRTGEPTSVMAFPKEDVSIAPED